MEFFVDKWTIQNMSSEVLFYYLEPLMKETLLDILTATALGLILCALALAYFDILTY